MAVELIGGALAGIESPWRRRSVYPRSSAGDRLALPRRSGGDLLADVGQLRDQLRSVLRPDSQQDLLAGRGRFQCRVFVEIETGTATDAAVEGDALHANRAGDVRRREQFVDHRHDAIVQVGARIPEVLIRALEQRIEPEVQRHGAPRVDAGGEAYEGRVALGVVRAGHRGPVAGLGLETTR